MRALLHRLHNIGDAMSQLLQVTVCPRPMDTSANESLSGRSHREGWWTEKVIDALFWVIERDHCRKAVDRDAERARQYLRQIE